MNFPQIERLRLERGISPTAMCRAAGVGGYVYWRARRGRTKPSAKTLSRWAVVLQGEGDLSVKRVRLPADAKATRRCLIRAAYRGHVLALATAMGLDPEQVAASDPQLTATKDPRWLAAQRVRSLAIFCTHVGLGINGAELARAIGMTKQAVSWNLKRVGELEGDPKYEKIMDAASRLVTGRPAGDELGAVWED